MAMILSSDSIDQFLSSIAVNGHSPNTVKAYRADLRGLLAATGELPVGRLEEPAAAWLTVGRKVWAPKTTCRKATSIRAWARWAGRPEFLANYRLPDPGRPEPHPIPEGMDGVALMLEACNAPSSSRGPGRGGPAQKRALVTLVCQMGLRVSEALNVTPESFNMVERTVTVTGKGDRRLVKPVPAACWPNLVDAIAGASYGPPRTPLIPWSERYARKVFTDLGRRAGLSRPISTHDGRATFATHVYRKTRDLRVTQELLGHSDARTTQVYTEVNMTGMRAAVDGAIG